MLLIQRAQADDGTRTYDFEGALGQQLFAMAIHENSATAFVKAMVVLLTVSVKPVW